MNDQSQDPGVQGPTQPTRYHHLIEHVQDAIVEFELVGGTPVVRNVNEAFVDIFGYPKADIIGESLNEWIVPGWLMEEAHSLDSQTSSREVTYRRVERETTGGLREFLYRGIPTEELDEPIDGIAIYTDITEISRTERRFKVMNRVLRHNLRNTANVLLGHTSQLLDELEQPAPEPSTAAATIEKAARDLEVLTEEARDINTILNAQSIQDASINIVSTLRNIVANYREQYPAVTIDTELPDSMPIRADDNIRFGFEPLLDNAIEHNPSERPQVRVSVKPAPVDGWVDILFDDDGPPIPEDERTVITGEAEITPQRHGSGLGLWLAKWSTEHFGGELGFETSDLGGNRVRLRLPRVTEPSE